MNRIIGIIAFLFFTVNGLKAQTEYIVRANPLNGNISKTKSIQGIRYLQSSPAYNENTKEYTFIGTFQPGQSPSYLLTLNSVSGNIISSPAILNSSSIISLRYSKSTGILYGLVSQNGVVSLATVNTISGTYAIIQNIPGIGGAGGFTIDEANQRLYLKAVDNNIGHALYTIDLNTGNIIYRAATQNINALVYSNTTQKICGIKNRIGTTPGSSINSFVTVDPITGIVNSIHDLPGISVYGGDHETINETSQIYFFGGTDAATPGLAYLYSININTGDILSKVLIPSSGIIDRDNLVFFRFDNNMGILNALFWEAHTHLPPPPPPSLPVNDSSCTIELKTKLYPNPIVNTLIVEKNPTKCKVSLSLYNILGQLVISNKEINDGHNEIQLRYLYSGFYFYRFTSGKSFLLKGMVFKK